MFKKLLVGSLVYVLLGTFLMPGFAGAKKPYTIGYVVMSLEYEYMVNLTECMKDEAQKLGVNLIVLDPRGSLDRSFVMVEDLVVKGVDLIIFSSIDMGASSAAVEYANKANVPILTCNSDTTGGEKVTYVGSSDRFAGILQADYLVMKLQGRGKVVYLKGKAADGTTIEGAKGFREIIANYPGIQIVSEFNANMSRALARSTMEDVLVVHPKPGSIDALVCQNDQMLMGALGAIEAVGRENEFGCLVGWDAIPEVVQAIKEGRVDASVFQDGETEGRESLRCAVKHLEGHKLPKVVNIPFFLVWEETVDEFVSKK